MIKPIGGFYEFIIPKKSFDFHKDAFYLSNGRACIRTIILNENISKCYIPNYTCDAVFHPFILENIKIEFYNIDNYLKPTNLPKLNKGEYFLYINYYGVKDDIVSILINEYGSNLIIDNTHSFFKKRIENNWSFTSARKYFGIPDGAFLYAPKKIKFEYERFINYSINHSIERLKSNQKEGFDYFTDYEKSLDSEIKKISLFSEKMLSLVDIEDVKFKRKRNFNFFNDNLCEVNKIKFLIDEDTVPYCFPFLPSKVIDKKVFYRESVFIPSLWFDPQNRIDKSTQFELELSHGLLPLPIDERYSIDDLERVLKIILMNK
jgi:hypothetical protein